MANTDKQLAEFNKFRKNHDLTYDPKTKKWSKPFHDVWLNGEFERWQLGQSRRKTCSYCGKLLPTISEEPKSRASKFCSRTHGKLHRKIVSEAKKRFDLKDFDIGDYDPKTFKNWMISFPSIYHWYYDKTGRLVEEQIKERVERKDITVAINGESFPLTTKSRTI